MVRYIKCPRCELNYIDGEKQEYCDICLKEMKGISIGFEELDEEDIPTELCPVCGENMMRVGEKMCEECLKKSVYDEEDTNPDEEDDEEWRNYLDDDADVELDEEIGEIDETFDEEFEEEEEEEEYHEDEEEDLDYVTGDEIYSLAGDDDDDEDEEENSDDF